MSDLRRRLKAWPKIDLHRHLEGSLRLETLSEIAHEHGVDLPGYEVETIRPLVQMMDHESHTYRNFLSKFRVLRHFFKSQEVLERVTYEAVADAAEDNIRYLELRFTPSALGNLGHFTARDVTRWVIESVRKAESDHDIRVGLIMNMNRHEDISVGEEITDLAIRYRGEIVALDLGGDEVAFSARPFAPLFKRAKDAGLGITVHAGEWKGSENIIESVKYLGADRIGHGVRIIENSDAVRFVKDKGITLEICPTSNLQSGAVTSFLQHPLADLLDLGLSITINTDDPSISNIELTDEYCAAVKHLGLTEDGIRKTILNAARAAFLPDDEKTELVTWFEEALASI